MLSVGLCVEVGEFEIAWGCRILKDEYWPTVSVRGLVLETELRNRVLSKRVKRIEL